MKTNHNKPIVLAAVLFTLVTLWVDAQDSNPIVLENQQLGSVGWEIEQLGTDAAGQIKGYASAPSVNKGENITFYVSTSPAQTYTIDVFRIGWYGGLGARLMHQAGPLNAVTQPPPNMDLTTGMLECHWPPAYILETQTTWTSGVYLALLKNQQGYQNYIVFVVRDDSRVASLLYQQPVTTYQAYNNYPNDGRTGKSLYDFNSYGQTLASSGYKSAVKVSFDRPYSDEGIDLGFFSDYGEINFIRWIERSGYDVTYSTSVDTHADGARLLNYRGFLSVGHDEYWSKPMRDAAEAARDAGINLGFFGANAVYWQIRFEPSSSGIPNRVIVCYKDSDFTSRDPVTDPNIKTVLWRDPPVNRPEQTLIGVQYTSQVPYNNGNWVNHIVNNSQNWVYAGTGLRDGDFVYAIVGYEADRFFSEYPGPNAVPGTYTLLSHSPYISAQGPDYSSASIYQAPSGAWVFGTGSMNWNWGLDSYQHGFGVEDPRIQRATANVLDQFIASAASGFFISASPSTQTLAAGSSTSYNITISPIGGFTGDLTFSVSGLPSGVGGSFTPNPATTSSALSITTSGSTPSGTYPITVTGTSGSLTKTAVVTLIVTVPDFTLAASPSTRTVAPGASTTYTATINPTGGFADAVTFSVSGLPNGASGTFAPNPATSSSTLSITTSTTTPGGTYPLTISGVGGGLTRNAAVSLTVYSGVTVTAPNTAVTWQVTTKKSITFTHNQGVGKAMNIDISRDGGSSWSPITTFTTTSATSGSYSWTVSGPPTTRARIRVTAAANPLVTDVSDVDFIITNPVVTVTSPNTAVSWRAGDTKNITFSHNMGVGQTVNIDVSRDGGLTWNLIGPFTTTSSTSGTYSWSVSGPPTTQARIRVSWLVDPSVTDMSDVDFKILPRMTVTAPNTAVTWGAGSTRTVTWTHNLGTGTTVDIDFSPDNGATWVSVASGVANATATTGSYTGPMPGIVTMQGLIRVSPAGQPTLGDTSDVPFTLATPTVTVTAPNTGVNWGIGSTKAIKWNHNLGTLDSVKIELARNGINYTETIAATVNSGSTSSTYNWVVTGPSTTTARIRVTWTANGTVTDISDVNFKIQ